MIQVGHYTSLEACLSMLETGEFHLTEGNDVRGDKEELKHINSGLIKGFAQDIGDHSSLDTSYDQNFRMLEKTFEEMPWKTYIGSFTQNPDESIEMWKFYHESDVLMVFDRCELKKNFRNNFDGESCCIMENVSYENFGYYGAVFSARLIIDSCPTRGANEPSETLIKNYFYAKFLTKHLRFAYENETRVLILLNAFGNHKVKCSKDGKKYISSGRVITEKSLKKIIFKKDALGIVKEKLKILKSIYPSLEFCESKIYR